MYNGSGTAQFKKCYSQLTAYSAAQIGKALEKLGIHSELKKINGFSQRVRYLPTHKVYSGIQRF